MKKYGLIGLVLFFSLFAEAQVTMTAQVPPEGVLMKAQLWNILVVSASSAPINIKVILRLTDSRTGQPVLTGISNTVSLTKGARQLQASSFSPVQYEYLSDAVDRSPNGLLSAGTYQACYSLIVEGGYKGDLAAEDCVPFAVSPVGPPLLNTPADQSVLETYNPQFTWLPPSPVTIFNNLNYELLLTEVRSGQTAAEAIQQNLPVYRLNYTKSLFASYPSSAMTLDTGKQYAWIIMAKNGDQFAAQTDVWTFRIKSNLPQPGIRDNIYVQMRKELDGSVAAMGENIRCSYTNEVNDSTAKYQLISLEEANTVLEEGVFKLERGVNWLDLPMKRKYHLQSGNSYLIRLQNSRNEYWQVKFIYSK